MISSGPITKAINSPDFDIIWTRLPQESEMKMYPTESCVMYLRSISSCGDENDGRSYVNNFFPKLLIANHAARKVALPINNTHCAINILCQTRRVAKQKTFRI